MSCSQASTYPFNSKPLKFMSGAGRGNNIKLTTQPGYFLRNDFVNCHDFSPVTNQISVKSCHIGRLLIIWLWLQVLTSVLLIHVQVVQPVVNL